MMRMQTPSGDRYHAREGEGSVTAKAGTHGLSNLRVKIIGYVFIVVGLFGSAMLIPSLGVDVRRASTGSMAVALLFEAASWCAVPLFAWLNVEAVRHTSHIGRYVLRLLALAVICEVPYDLSTSGSVVDVRSQNPVWALCITTIVLWICRRYAGRRDTASWIVRTAVLLAAGLDMYLFHIYVRQTLFQGGVLLLGFALIFYALSAHENTMMLAGVAWGMSGLLPPSIGMVVLHYRNGTLGYPRDRRHRWITWCFYALYPGVLLIFALARLAM